MAQAQAQASYVAGFPVPLPLPPGPPVRLDQEAEASYVAGFSRSGFLVCYRTLARFASRALASFCGSLRDEDQQGCKTNAYHA